MVSEEQYYSGNFLHYQALVLSTCFDEIAKEVISFTSKHLEEFTDNFDVKNRIGPTQFGEMYRGKMKDGEMCKNVVVKIWTEQADYLEDARVPYIFIKEEVWVLKDKATKSHPNLVNVIGICCEENVRGIVYDLDPLDTLHNFMMKDDFGWAERIMVALQFAQLLEFLHRQENPYVVHSLDPQHILLDHMFNPILCDFGLMSGGIIGEMSFIKRLRMPPQGYDDPEYSMWGPMLPRRDVYLYGMILLGIIAKKMVEKEDIIWRQALALDAWAKKVYTPGSSLVHQSFKSERGFCASDAYALTELCMCCITKNGRDRPTMTEVVNGLKQLQAVKDVIPTQNCSLPIHHFKGLYSDLGKLP